MVLSEALLAEFDQEVVTARKTLERVPEDRFDLAPHTKSWLMGWLAGHLANILGRDGDQRGRTRPRPGW